MNFVHPFLGLLYSFSNGEPELHNNQGLGKWRIIQWHRHLHFFLNFLFWLLLSADLTFWWNDLLRPQNITLEQQQFVILCEIWISFPYRHYLASLYTEFHLPFYLLFISCSSLLLTVIFSTQTPRRVLIEKLWQCWKAFFCHSRQLAPTQRRLLPRTLGWQKQQKSLACTPLWLYLF